MLSFSVRCFAAIVLMLASVVACWGQALTGDILGTVRDSTGAVVADAQVILTQVGTGATSSAITDSEGNYSFASLKPAHYSLEVSKANFEKTIVPDIVLLVAQRQRLDIILRVGATSQRVEVSAGAAVLLETQTSEVGQVIQEKPIVELPLDGRDFIQLATLAPGVYPIAGAYSCSSQGYGTGAKSGTSTFTAMGLRESDVSYLVDGIETRGARWGNATVRPSVDAIQEFKVQTEDYSADNGRSSIIVNIALKSGTDTVHGSAYEFLRNSALDANDFFLNKTGVPRPGFQQNNFGTSIGGPIVFPRIYNGRHKTFFFGDYEGIRSLQSGTFTGLYPSAAQLAGNLADDSTGTGIFPTSSPFCQANAGSTKCMDVIDPTTGNPFPGNVIPTGRLDTIAQKWLPYINQPNVNVPANQASLPGFNFVKTPKEKNNADLFHIRVDHEFNEKNHLFGSYSFDQRPHFVPGLAILGGETFPWRAQVLALGETHIFTPTVVNEFRFGYARSRNGGISETAFGPNISADVFGFQNVPNRPIAFGVPTAGISGFWNVGSYSIPEDSLDRTFQYVDNLSIVRGKNTLKLGGSFFHEKFIYICDCAATPTFSFDGRFTRTGLGDFLLGIPNNATQSVGQGFLDSTANYYAGYFEDDLRPRSDLTLNLGIRYEYQQNPQDINGREETFLPSTGQVAAVFRGEIRNGLVNPDYKDWGPRVGFAYSPSFLKNTVIRSSFGIFYGTGNWNEFGFAAFGPDFIVNQNMTLSDPKTPSLSLKNMFPAVQLGPQNKGPNIGIFGVDPNNSTPYVQEWSFGIQHTFGSDWLVDVGYAGNVAQHLQQRRDANTPSFDPSGTRSIASRRPYKDYSYILMTFAGGWSSYNALMARLEKKVTANSFLLVSYTWAKALDTFNAAYGTNASRDIKVYDKGNSLYVAPQRFSVSYSYSLPIGRNRRFWSSAHGVADKLVSGWEVSGITTFQSGQYTTPYLPFDLPNLGPFSGALPNRVGPVIPAHRTYNNWWDSTGFAVPGCPTIVECSSEVHIEGNASKGSLQGPGINNWDISLEKNTSINERMRLQFRTEFFNAWNHTQFGNPNPNLIPGQFGQITSLLISPRQIQVGLKLLW